MNPINLADLPSNQPAPTGLVQIKRGAADGVANYSMGSGRQWIIDGGGGYMQIAITPPRAGWWLLRAETIWTTDYPGWTSLTWSIQVNADEANVATNYLSLHSTIGWQESVMDIVYPLSAGVAYTAGLVWANFGGAGTHSIWTGGGYTFIAGEFVGEGAI